MKFQLRCKIAIVRGYGHKRGIITALSKFKLIKTSSQIMPASGKTNLCYTPSASCYTPIFLYGTKLRCCQIFLKKKFAEIMSMSQSAKKSVLPTKSTDCYWAFVRHAVRWECKRALLFYLAGFWRGRQRLARNWQTQNPIKSKGFKLRFQSFLKIW